MNAGETLGQNINISLIVFIPLVFSNSGIFLKSGGLGVGGVYGVRKAEARDTVGWI